MFFCEFRKILKDIFTFGRTPPDDYFLCLSLNFEFFSTLFYTAPPENCYFVYKLQNFNHQIQ